MGLVPCPARDAQEAYEQSSSGDPYIQGDEMPRYGIRIPRIGRDYCESEGFIIVHKAKVHLNLGDIFNEVYCSFLN